LSINKKVVVFSQPGWVFCGKVKEFLSQNKIDYTERSIVTDGTALAELEKLGYMTTPVTVIDGEAVVGFDRAKLERLLLQSWSHLQAAISFLTALASPAEFFAAWYATLWTVGPPVRDRRPRLAGRPARLFRTMPFQPSTLNEGWTAKKA
jgi:glutaredoxin 3